MTSPLGLSGEVVITLSMERTLNITKPAALTGRSGGQVGRVTGTSSEEGAAGWGVGGDRKSVV